MSAGAARTEFTYDGRGLMVRRVQRDGGTVVADERYVWCDTGLCERRNAQGTVLEQSFTLGTERNGVLSFHTTDHLGSLTEVVAANQLVARFSYDPFGRAEQVGAGTGTPTFAGLRMDSSTGLFFGTYRAYDAALGRWLSADPAGTVDGPNVVAYAANDPVNSRDPSGLSGWHENVTVTAMTNPFVVKSQCGAGSCGACGELKGGASGYCVDENPCQARMKMDFRLTAKLHVYTGDDKLFGLVNNCKPHDTSVVDGPSAEAHERGHISDIKTLVVAAMEAEETVYPSKDACKKALKGAVKRVNSAFQKAAAKSRSSRH